MYRLGQVTPVVGRMRVIRAEGKRAIVEVPHLLAGKARAAWTGKWTTVQGVALQASTIRTFGTLRKGKEW
ncbi:MAG: hypothetical protein L3J96_01930, partial [Thermoplasmata archaeon]|nr:hypothetical protein [Thermoplasmata archaeon]